MLKRLCSFTILSFLSLLCLPQLLWAKTKVGNLVVVAHTAGLSGLSLYWANIYNDNMFLFTIFTGCIVPVAGLLLGWLGDWLLGLTGIDLSKRELAEH